ELAAAILWFDAYIENVDRSWRNPNLLVWHKQVWLIDHGASLYFHHNWAGAAAAVTRRYDARDHVRADHAGGLPAVDAKLSARLTPDLLTEVLDQVPGAWLIDSGFDDPSEARARYLAHLVARAAASESWLPVGEGA